MRDKSKQKSKEFNATKEKEGDIKYLSDPNGCSKLQRFSNSNKNKKMYIERIRKNRHASAICTKPFEKSFMYNSRLTSR